MVTGYEVGYYRDVGLIAQEVRMLRKEQEATTKAVERVADARERANELTDMVQEVGEVPDS